MRRGITDGCVQMSIDTCAKIRQTSEKTADTRVVFAPVQKDPKRWWSPML